MTAGGSELLCEAIVAADVFGVAVPLMEACAKGLDPATAAEVGGADAAFCA